MSRNTDSNREISVSAQNPADRDTRGRFKKGGQAGPGRGKGRKNRLNEVIDRLLEENGEDIVQRILRGARSGDVACMKLVVERLTPPRRSRIVRLDDFPAVVDLETADAAQTRVLSAVTAGEIGLEEGQALSDLIAQKRQILEARDILVRIRALESRTGATGPLLDHAELPPFRQLPSLFDEDNSDES